MAKTLAASIRAFGERALAKADAIYGDSIHDVLDIAQTPRAQGGRMPVDTGFLRNGLVSELNGSELAKGAESFALVASDLKMGDTCAFAWTAAYAARQELGFTGEDKLGRTYAQGGNHFAGAAAAQWQNCVKNNAEDAAR